jgi:ADP-heptose:LPS heptosyltransferase
LVLHNDPNIDASKAWPWENLRQLVAQIGPHHVVLLGHPGPPVEGVLDLRGQTSLAQAAAIIAACRCYIGIDSGLMWMAGSLQVPTVGLYGTSYIPAYQAIQPINPRAVYLQAQGGLDAIPVGAVLQALEQVLERHRRDARRRPDYAPLRPPGSAGSLSHAAGRASDSPGRDF